MSHIWTRDDVIITDCFYLNLLHFNAHTTRVSGNDQIPFFYILIHHKKDINSVSNVN